MPRMPRRRRGALALALPLFLLLGACASDAPQDTLDPKGPIARQIDDLVNPVFLVAAVVFVIVEFGTLAMVLKFRKRRGEDDDDLPAQTHGNTKLEIGWTVLPAAILAVVAVGTIGTLININSRDDAAMTVRVEGQQWWWRYSYDVDGDGRFEDEEPSTGTDLVIPAGVDVELEIHSNDVIHSFWIPSLNGKKDAVPGRTHTLTLNADEPGTYVGQCTEFCGLSHAYMRQRAVALPQDEFDDWLANQATEAEEPEEGTEAALGAELFTTQCSRCHVARGINDEEWADEGDKTLVAGEAPELTHFATRGAFAGGTYNLWEDLDGDDIVEYDEIGGELNRIDLEAWLRNPPGQKPMAPEARGMPNLQLQEEQIDQLVAFLQTLD
ncbi:MAG TPA: cytochrome c oxidase subunit II [Acidimicrobiales bacterium]|nr:cytochrome c oxidase subunit II [Acidimicrobiales bacterium]